MWAGEGGGEGRDQDQGDDPPGHEDHGDGLELPENRENGENSHLSRERDGLFSEKVK